MYEENDVPDSELEPADGSDGGKGAWMFVENRGGSFVEEDRAS